MVSMPKSLATDPPVSEAQRRAMWAAASGHSTLNIPEGVGKEFANADPGGKLPATAKDMTGEEFGLLRRLINKFFGEESDEPEHHEAGQDDAPKGRAASVAFVCPDGRTLFVKRAHDASDPHSGKWCWPGGQAGDDEEFEAARREVTEEAGKDCSFDKMTELHRGRTERGWDHVSYVVPVEKPFSPQLSDEHSGHVWAYPDDAPQPLHPGVKKTMDETFRKLERSLAHKKGVENPNALAAYIGREHGKIPADEFHESEHQRSPNGQFGLGEKLQKAREKTFFAGQKPSNGWIREQLYRHSPELQSSKKKTEELRGIASKAQTFPGSERTPEVAAHIENAINAKKSEAALYGRLRKEHFGDAEDESEETKERHEGKLSEREESAANPHVEARADKPKSIYLLPVEEKYPVKEKQGGEWKYTRNLLLAAAREARMHGRTDLARRADAIRAREFPEEEAADIAMKRVKGGMEEAGVWLSPLLKREAALSGVSEADVRRLSNASVANVARDAAPIDWSRFRYPQPTKLAFDHATLAVGHEVVGLAFDRASVRGIDNDGRLHVDTSNLTKENISKYKGSEIPGWEKLGLDPNRIYKLYRPADELEKPETVESFNGIPVLNKHIPIDADSHAERSKYVIGSTGTHAKFQRPYMKNALAFWPKGSIDNIENERTKELSAGYAYTPDMTPGMFNGEPYDGRMTKIRAQHMALIPEGRVGHDVAVADEKPRAFSFSQV